MMMGITFDNRQTDQVYLLVFKWILLIQNRTKVLQNYKSQCNERNPVKLKLNYNRNIYNTENFKLQNFGRENFENSTSIYKICHFSTFKHSALYGILSFSGFDFKWFDHYYIPLNQYPHLKFLAISHLKPKICIIFIMALRMANTNHATTDSYGYMHIESIAMHSTI